MIIFHKRDSFHRLDEQTQYNEKMQNPNHGKKTEVWSKDAAVAPISTK